MTHDTASRNKPGLSGAFTSRGKRGASTWFKGAWPGAAAFLLFLTLATPAAADPQLGPTSSASVGISVSVAPGFRLAPTISMLEETNISAAYCIATNGAPTALPILLVQPNDGDAGDRPANRLPWCEAGKDPPQGQARAEVSSPAKLLIIRPE
jgi:hypothetical protein